MELDKDINETGSKILELLKDFEKRQGYMLEVKYDNKIFTTKLVTYFK